MHPHGACKMTIVAIGKRADEAEAALAAERARVAELESDFEEYRQVTRQADAAASKAEEQRNAERARADAAVAALRAADDLARVLDTEVMPRYMELMAALHLGDSVVDPMARQALDAYRDARAILQAADQRGGEVGDNIDERVRRLAVEVESAIEENGSDVDLLWVQARMRDILRALPAPATPAPAT